MKGTRVFCAVLSAVLGAQLLPYAVFAETEQMVIVNVDETEPATTTVETTVELTTTEATTTEETTMEKTTVEATTTEETTTEETTTEETTTETTTTYVEPEPSITEIEPIYVLDQPNAAVMYLHIPEDEIVFLQITQHTPERESLLLYDAKLTGENPLGYSLRLEPADYTVKLSSRYLRDTSLQQSVEYDFTIENADFADDLFITYHDCLL